MADENNCGKCGISLAGKGWIRTQLPEELASESVRVCADYVSCRTRRGVGISGTRARPVR